MDLKLVGWFGNLRKGYNSCGVGLGWRGGLRYPVLEANEAFEHIFFCLSFEFELEVLA